MSFPVILIDSSTGSDTAASGAGPATALTGTAAATSGDGLTATLDGSPDLSSVLTDGTHVVWLNDTTANARNFAAITGKDNTAKTVTVSNAFAFSLTGKTWAIGGKRASIGSTTSRRLVEQSASGDWMPGWTVRFASGHAETLSAALTLRRAGNITDGPMRFEASPNAAVMPSLTWSANVSGLTISSSGKKIRGIKLRNTNATKSNAAILIGNAMQNVAVVKCTLGETGAGWLQGVSYAQNNHGTVEILCNDIGFCSVGVSCSSTSTIAGNYLHDLSSHGILGNSSHVIFAINNVFASIGGDGIRTSTAMATLAALSNTFDSVTGNGINILDVTPATEHVTIFNNNFSNVTGFGISWAVTAAAAEFVVSQIWNNNFYQCTAGVSNPADLVQEDQFGLDPQYVNAAGGDYTIGNSGLTSHGFPGSIGAASNHLSVGAIQPASGASSGGVSLVGNGGLVY